MSKKPVVSQSRNSDKLFKRYSYKNFTRAPIFITTFMLARSVHSEVSIIKLLM